MNTSAPSYSSRGSLNAAGYDLSTPFELRLKDSRKSFIFRAEDVLRVLPGKRLVLRGLLEDSPVVAKVYLAGRAAERHVRREVAGFRALVRSGVPTPRLVFEGRLAEDGTPVLGFEELAGWRTLEEVVEGNSSGEFRREQIGEVVAILARLHDAGLYQADIHPGNFLLADRRVQVIDTDSVQAIGRDKTLGSRSSLINLGLFVAQFGEPDDVSLSHFLSIYISRRKRTVCGWNLADLKGSVRQQWTLRKDRYLKKLFRGSSENVYRRTWNARTICKREVFHGDVLDFLATPDAYMERGEVLKEGNSSTVVRVKLNGEAMVVKRYNIKNTLHALKRCVQPTRAARSWKNAHLLGMLGVATPDPILLHEQLLGPFRGKAYYISRWVGVRALPSVFNPRTQAGADDETLLADEFVRMIIRFRDHCISHGDMKASNFMIGEGRLWVTDLDSMKQHKSRRGHHRAMKKDCRRWIRNWETLPALRDRFCEKLLQAGCLARDS